MDLVIITVNDWSSKETFLLVCERRVLLTLLNWTDGFELNNPWLMLKDVRVWLSSLQLLLWSSQPESNEFDLGVLPFGSNKLSSLNIDDLKCSSDAKLVFISWRLVVLLTINGIVRDLGRFLFEDEISFDDNEVGRDADDDDRNDGFRRSSKGS